jgi:hypothetical protein
LGLADTSATGALMNASYSEAFSGPQADDIAGAVYLYGAVAPLTGDMNGDHEFDFGDTTAFVLALTDRPAFETTFPGVNADVVGDMDGSGGFDFGDIVPFINMLNAPVSLAELSGAARTPVPEPASGALLVMGVVAVVGLGVLRLSSHLAV